MIQVLLIDDHKLILENIEKVLEEIETINIIKSYTSPVEALAYILDHDIDVVVTGLDMAEMNGIKLTKAIRKDKPEQNIIVLSLIDEQSIINQMIKHDVNGYIMKNDTQAELSTAIRHVHEGNIYYNKEIRKRIFLNHIKAKKPADKSIPQLSEREKEILQLIINEHTAKEIAAKLFIAEGTVITHRKHIITKLGAKNTAGIVRIGIELGLV